MTSHDQGNGIPSRILALTGGVWMPSSQFLISTSISWKNGMLCHFEPMLFAWHHGIYIYIEWNWSKHMKINHKSSIYILMIHESVVESIHASSPEVLWVDRLLHLDESTGPSYGRPPLANWHSSIGSNMRLPCRWKRTRRHFQNDPNGLIRYPV
jgi:hypothetical protein